MAICSSKRFSRLNIKYQNGAGNADEDADEIDESPSKKTPKKANRSGKGIVKAERDEKIAITAPRAAGVGKKRSPTKPKATAGGGVSTSSLTTVATADGVDLKMGTGSDDGKAEEFVPGFFDEQMDRGVGAEHGDDTD